MKKWITYLIIVVIVGAIIGGVLVNQFYFNKNSSDEETIKVEKGDTVQVHYTGWLQDERIYNGRRVFDTSRENIAGETIITFTERERGDPYKFTVGEGSVIQAWDEEIIGMEEGETNTFTAPKEKAYDTRLDDIVLNVSKTETLPVYEEMSESEFTNRHGFDPSVNKVVEDKFWRWDQTVIEVSGGTVLLRNEPEVGETYRTYKQDGPGWSTEVMSIDSNANEGKGEIKVQHSVEEGITVNSRLIASHDSRFEGIPGDKSGAGQSGQPTGIVVDVGENITIDFNEEVAGKDLTFRITVVDIQKGE
ncbi:MAG: FKBP-type peptidyl-prolyl cis-trans isomerase [Thermoplasmatota archaeon]